MPHELFEEITTPARRGSARSPYTIALSIAAHVAVIGAVVIVPLLATDVLPNPIDSIGWIPVAPAPPPPPPAKRIPPPKSNQSDTPDRQVPLDAPDGVQDEAPIVSARSEAPTIGDPIGATEGLTGSVGKELGRPEPPPKPTPEPPKGPVKIGGDIREPAKVHNVSPIYPAIAQGARIQGAVVIQAVISVDGSVQETQVLSGHPLLQAAALDAVRQWRYRPTLLNGVPVPVMMTVSVRFTLQ